VWLLVRGRDVKEQPIGLLDRLVRERRVMRASEDEKLALEREEWDSYLAAKKEEG